MRRATSSYALYVIGTVISIHALHEESDHKEPTDTLVLEISIHALHEESDPQAEFPPPERLA